MSGSIDWCMSSNVMSSGVARILNQGVQTFQFYKGQISYTIFKLDVYNNLVGREMSPVELNSSELDSTR